MIMKYLALFLIAAIGVYSCDSGKSTMKANKEEAVITPNDTIRIANDELEYEIIIIEPGFDSWLVTQPPQGHHDVSYLESRNRNFVSIYNDRVRNSMKYSRILYPQEINYDIGTHYGLEVNYMLYNYFVYFQQRYKQKFIGGRY